MSGPWSDENGVPTVAGAEAMFDALDRGRERQEARAAELRVLRATTAEQTRALRLRRAVDALRAAGFDGEAAALAKYPTRAEHCRATVGEMRRRLADGSDEPRYAACSTALEALGALWAVLA